MVSSLKASIERTLKWCRRRGVTALPPPAGGAMASTSDVPLISIILVSFLQVIQIVKLKLSFHSTHCINNRKHCITKDFLSHNNSYKAKLSGLWEMNRGLDLTCCQIEMMDCHQLWRIAYILNEIQLSFKMC